MNPIKLELGLKRRTKKFIPADKRGTLISKVGTTDPGENFIYGENTYYAVYSVE